MKAHVYVSLKKSVLDPQGKTIQGALGKMGYKGVQEIRQAHLNDWFNALTRRFEPKIEKPEFFARPSSALPLPKSAARPNPLGPGKP